MKYIISQIFAILTYGLMGATYYTKNRKSLLLFNMAAILTNATSYFFLSAWMGVFTTLVAFVRNIIFLIQNRKPNDKINWVDWLTISFFMIILIGIAFFTYDGPLSLFSFFSSLTYTIAVWQRNESVYKVLGIISSICTIGYFVFVRSLFGLILELCLFVVILVGAIRFFKKKKFSKLDKSENLS